MQEVAHSANGLVLVNTYERHEKYFNSGGVEFADTVCTCSRIPQRTTRALSGSLTKTKRSCSLAGERGVLQSLRTFSVQQPFSTGKEVPLSGLRRRVAAKTVTVDKAHDAWRELPALSLQTSQRFIADGASLCRSRVAGHVSVAACCQQEEEASANCVHLSQSLQLHKHKPMTRTVRGQVRCSAPNVKTKSTT